MKLAFVFLVIFIAAQAQRTHRNKLENKAVLALSWLAGFCQSIGDCRTQTLNAWDHQSFTIHGYWADRPSPDSYGSFNISLFNGTLLADMKDFWPSQSRRTHSSYFLWQHEFKDHGSDFSHIYFNQHKADFAGLSNYQQDKKLQRIYFSTTIELYKALKLRKIPKSHYSKAEFATYLGLKENQFSLVCNQNSNLQQIKICYDIRPLGSVIVQCMNVSSKNCNKNQIVLRSWKMSKQNTPVTKS